MPMKKNLQREIISNIKTLCSSWNEDIIHDNEKYTLKQITKRRRKNNIRRKSVCNILPKPQWLPKKQLPGLFCH